MIRLSIIATLRYSFRSNILESLISFFKNSEGDHSCSLVFQDSRIIDDGKSFGFCSAEFTSKDSCLIILMEPNIKVLI